MPFNGKIADHVCVWPDGEGYSISVCEDDGTEMYLVAWRPDVPMAWLRAVKEADYWRIPVRRQNSTGQVIEYYNPER